MRKIVPGVFSLVVLTALVAVPGSLTLRAQAKPVFERAPDALERVTWRTRTLVSDDRLTNWNFAVPANGLTFLEAVVRADAAVVDFVEGSNTQQVSPQISKNLDYNLTADEIATIRSRMGPVKLLTYRVDALRRHVVSTQDLRVRQGDGRGHDSRAGERSACRSRYARPTNPASTWRSWRMRPVPPA